MQQGLIHSLEGDCRQHREEVSGLHSQIKQLSEALAVASGSALQAEVLRKQGKLDDMTLQRDAAQNQRSELQAQLEQSSAEAATAREVQTSVSSARPEPAVTHGRMPRSGSEHSGPEHGI